MTKKEIDPLPFDPKTTGPLEVGLEAARRGVEFVRRRERELLGTALAIVVLQVAVFAWKGIVFLRPPGIPSWILVGVGTAIVFTPIAIVGGWLIAWWLDTEETVLVSVQSAITGDQQIKHLTPEKFRTATIYNVDPTHEHVSPDEVEKVKRDYLEVVRVNGRRAYEVQHYDPEEDVMIASSMAGRSNSDIRRDRHEIGAIKHDLIPEVDKATEFIVRAHGILRRQGEEVVNEIMRVVEDVELPNGGALHDRLVDARDDADPTDELLESSYETDRLTDDGDEEDVEDLEIGGESDYSDLFERAAERERAATDGGEDT